jgi:3-methyladenine DNA glycosylase AlkC
MGSKALEEIELFRKEKLKSLYEQCTKPQQDLFNRMYGSLEQIPPSKIDWAIKQRERTIIKNHGNN